MRCLDDVLRPSDAPDSLRSPQREDSHREKGKTDAPCCMLVVPLHLTFDIDSPYCLLIRKYFVNTVKEWYRINACPIGIKKAVDLTMASIAREKQEGKFRDRMPQYERVKRQGNYSADDKQYRGGVTETICIKRRMVMGFMDSCYIPQPLQYEGVEREMLFKLSGKMIEQGTLI